MDHNTTLVDCGSYKIPTELELCTLLRWIIHC